MNDEEKIKKATTFIDSFLVRTNTNLKKYAASKDSPDKESVIEILESQKRVLEKIKEILTQIIFFVINPLHVLFQYRRHHVLSQQHMYRQKAQ